MKSRLKIIALISIIGHCTKATNKRVIGCQPGAGLFYNFLGVINNLQYCKKNNLEPIVYWGKHNLYYEETGYQGSKNVWEYYFEPISNASYTSKDYLWNSNRTPDGEEIIPIANEYCEKYAKQEFREAGHTIIQEYVKLKPYIKQKVESFFQEHMFAKKTIGIHLRGTDKKAEIQPVNPDDILNDANVIAQNFPGCQFFIATDEERLLKKAQSILKRKVIYYDAYRSSNGQAIHWGNKKLPKAKLAEEVIIEATLLSRCDFFLHTCSSVSTAVLLLNPQLNHKAYTA